MLKPDTLALTAVLALLTALGPLSTDMYLPSLPTIARDFGATTAETQLTLSAFLIGFAVGQFVYGPVSDKVGRRPVYFLGAGAVAMVIAWGTVFVHAWRVANAKPILALRYE